MSIQTQIDRISDNVTAALSAIVEKGVTVPEGSTSDALAGLIASIEAGGRWKHNGWDNYSYDFHGPKSRTRTRSRATSGYLFCTKSSNEY